MYNCKAMATMSGRISSAVAAAGTTSVTSASGGIVPSKTLLPMQPPQPQRQQPAHPTMGGGGHDLGRLRLPRPRQSLGGQPSAAQAAAAAIPSHDQQRGSAKMDDNTADDGEIRVPPRRLFIRDAIVCQHTSEMSHRRDATTNDAAATRTCGGTKRGLYVRLMGVVTSSTTSSPFISSLDSSSAQADVDSTQQQPHQQQQNDQRRSFVLDDGTASVEVVRMSAYMTDIATNSESHPLHTAKKPRLGILQRQQQQKQQQQEARENNFGLPELGALVDCVGYLTLPPEDPSEEARKEEGGNDIDTDEHSRKGADQVLEEASAKSEDDADRRSTQSSSASPSPRLALLSAESVATVTDPNAESLRSLELLLSASSSPSARNGSSCGNITGIHVAADLISKIGAFRPQPPPPSSVLGEDECHGNSGNTNTNTSTIILGGSKHGGGMRAPPPPMSVSRSKMQPPGTSKKAQYCIDEATAFRLIKSAAMDGGLSEEDIGIALGCKSTIGPADNDRNRRRSSSSINKDIMGTLAVREVLQELQLRGEIYKTRRGTYLPL